MAQSEGCAGGWPGLLLLRCCESSPPYRGAWVLFGLDVSDFSCWLCWSTGIVCGQSEQVDEYQSEENAIKTPSEMWLVLHEVHDLGTASTQISGLPSFQKCVVQSPECLFNSDSAAVNNISRCFPVGVSQGTVQHEWSTSLSSVGPYNGAQLDKKTNKHAFDDFFQKIKCIYPLMPIHNVCTLKNCTVWFLNLWWVEKKGEKKANLAICF